MGQNDVQKQTVSTCMGILLAFSVAGACIFGVAIVMFSGCMGAFSGAAKNANRSQYDQVPKSVSPQSPKPVSRLEALADAFKAKGFLWSDYDGPTLSTKPEKVSSGTLFNFHRKGSPVDITLDQYVPGMGPFRGERSSMFESSVIRVGDFSVFWDKDKPPTYEDAQSILEVLKAFQSQ